MNTCSLCSCPNVEIHTNQDFCEIKTVFPTTLSDLEKRLKSSKKAKLALAVRWKKNGQAKFHSCCWEYLLKASRKRSTKIKGELNVCEEEKVLVKEAAKTVEYFEAQEKIEEKAARIADLIEKSKHFVCFTGAGISTSAGIGDYRGKSGKWTQQDQAKLKEETNTDSSPSHSKKPRLTDKDDDGDEDEDEEDDGVNYENLRPTYTHEALQKLMEKGFLKYVISQNGDGLHTLSKIPMDKISELHGNVFVEKCEECGERYERSYYVMDDEASQYFEDLEEFKKSDIKKPVHAKKCELCGLCHRTGRKCEKKGCTGYLIDTIINFRDNLEDEIYDRAVCHAEKSDLMLCLGTTLLVTPANELVEMTKEPQKIVICNRQKTPLDHLYKTQGKEKEKGTVTEGVRVYGDCDVLMKEVMKNILKPDELSHWERDRSKRLLEYDKLRQTPN